MDPLFNIFRLQTDGALVWCESVDCIETAARRIEALRAKASATFVLVNVKTGHRRIFGASASEEAKPSAA